MAMQIPSGRFREEVTGAYRVDAYLRVLGALMLRDMRTRFMGSYWGYVAQILWPVTHMFIIAGALAVRGMPAPFGDSVMIFAASGAVPSLAFQYISREMMKGILTNKPLTYYPQVRGLDVMFSRVIVEVIGSFIGIMTVMLILLAMGIDPVPPDIGMAIGGYLCAVLFGVSVGTINSAIVQFFPGWLIGWILFNILIYLGSGVVFMPSDLPDQIYSIMKWNPVLQTVEWVRLGYAPNLPIQIDHTYLFLWVASCFSLGLLLEKTVSRRSA